MSLWRDPGYNYSWLGSYLLAKTYKPFPTLKGSQSIFTCNSAIFWHVNNILSICVIAKTVSYSVCGYSAIHKSVLQERPLVNSYACIALIRWIGHMRTRRHSQNAIEYWRLKESSRYQYSFGCIGSSLWKQYEFQYYDIFAQDLFYLWMLKITCVLYRVTRSIEITKSFFIFVLNCI